MVQIGKDPQLNRMLTEVCHGPLSADQATWREHVMDAYIVVHRNADLVEVRLAIGSPRGLACRLHCWQQESDQDADDPDRDQELDQRKPGLAWALSHDSAPFDSRRTRTLNDTVG